MNLKHTSLTLTLFVCVFLSFAQKHHKCFEKIDVVHYKFEIHLNDSSNRIEGRTVATVKFLKPTENFRLDLIGPDSTKYGMTVKSVVSAKKEMNFSHNDNQLLICLENVPNTNEPIQFEINYSGIPADGLVISKNKYGQRTFFGDNWPDRAKHWLPTVDHPSDKASLEFLVYAPGHYEVVSNGYLVEKTKLDNNFEFTHWKTNVPISTKLMVIGVAKFAIGNKETFQSIPVSSWVFPPNKQQGFKNYSNGVKALAYFSQLIGSYSYEKLAHVQSKTRYGGMENASCIFYSERTGYSENSQERLFAHEVAHQWFGNSATEQNWHHVWLSEGFATYLTHVYKQHFQGEEVFLQGLENDRERVIRYAQRNPAPIIDTTVTEYIRLLNTNSYQKASWFLHMLRMDLGDEVFFKGLREYYSAYKNSTALTKDFKKIMEIVSGKELDLFFKQWLWQAGHPVLEIAITTKSDRNNILKSSLTVNQIQGDYLFNFPLEIEFKYEDGSSEVQTFYIDQRENKFPLELKSKHSGIETDPNTKLLFEFQGRNIH